MHFTVSSIYKASLKIGINFIESLAILIFSKSKVTSHNWAMI